MIHTGKKELIRSFSGILSFFNKLVPKNHKKIVFYSNMGFRDNVKAVYDYLLTCQCESYKIICAVNDFEMFADRPHPKNVKFVSPMRGVFHFFTARCFFYSFGKYPIKPSKSQMVINLWHGSPLKKIGNYLDNEDQNFFTYVLAASDFFKPVMQKAFNCREEQVKVCGHPRNDALFSTNNALGKLGYDQGYLKFILWMPTFRQSAFLGVNDTGGITSQTGLPILSTRSALAKVNEQLRGSNSLLLAKIHPAQDLSKIDLSEYSNIKVLSNDRMQQADCNLYELLACADGLVTDYSSVYFDYLILNRPIGFTVDDIEEYEKNRGFVVENPRELMPGQFINTPEEFSLYIADVLSGNDKFADRRKVVGILVNQYHDGCDCRRVLELAGIL